MKRFEFIALLLSPLLGFLPKKEGKLSPINQQLLDKIDFTKPMAWEECSRADIDKVLQGAAKQIDREELNKARLKHWINFWDDTEVKVAANAFKQK